MCGATDAQVQLGGEEMQAYKEAQQLTQEQYSNQQAILSKLTPQFESIFAQGPNQEGYSQPEEDTINSQVLEGTATNYKQAATAVNEEQAAEGGGNIPLPTGEQVAERERVAESAAQEQSQEQTQVKEAGYQQGYKQYLDAASGLEGVAGEENPLGYESAATSSGTAAADTENQIASEQNSWVNAAIGAASAVSTAAAAHHP